MTKYLGVKLFEHDSTVFMLDCKEKKLFGISTERFTRIKHDENFIWKMKEEYPFLFEDAHSVSSCFNLDHKEYHISKLKSVFLKELVYDIYKPKYIKEFSEKINKIKTSNVHKALFFSRAVFKRQFYTYLKCLYANHTTKKNKKKNNNAGRKFIVDMMKREFPGIKPTFEGHHLSHALTAYHFSPYNKEKALVFTFDGKGVNLFSSLWLFEKDKWKYLGKSENVERPTGQVPQTMSIGILYSIFTGILGFRPLSDEGKTEALAAFGKPDSKLLKEIEMLFPMDIKNLGWKVDKKMLKVFTNEYLTEKMEEIGRENFAATIQHFLEKAVVKYLDIVHKKYKIDTLCLAGGVFANVILNLAIFEKTKFKNIYIFPAMGDDGAALGAAMLEANRMGEDLSWLSSYEMPYLGPEIDKENIERELEKRKDVLTYKKVDSKDIAKLCAELICKNKIVALVQGRMEFGPRALGNRSILANPTNEKTKDRINEFVKRRPKFQPFCPSVLEEERERLFENSYKHKHMAIAFRLKKEFYKKLPSAIHIDGTARPQFVEKQDNFLYWSILNEIKKLNGFGVVINTSFNLHGRTIVRTAQDAVTDFIDCNIDAMFIEGWFVKRKN